MLFSRNAILRSLSTMLFVWVCFAIICILLPFLTSDSSDKFNFPDSDSNETVTTFGRRSIGSSRDLRLLKLEHDCCHRLSLSLSLMSVTVTLSDPSTLPVFSRPSCQRPHTLPLRVVSRLSIATGRSRRPFTCKSLTLTRPSFKSLVRLE
jgi:hypothetical protein